MTKKSSCLSTQWVRDRDALRVSWSMVPPQVDVNINESSTIPENARVAHVREIGTSARQQGLLQHNFMFTGQRSP